MHELKEIRPEELSENIFDLIGKQWMLVTAGTQSSFNTMTASWGGMGVLWNSPVAFSFVRPQRYTNEFIERSDYYSLSFYDEKYRSALALCGKKSGREVDKLKETGLTPAFSDNTVYFSEAKLVLLCKKLYAGKFSPADFVDPQIEKNYQDKDYHNVYIGKIIKVLSK